MRRRLELTEIARADLRSIRRHSIRTWGQDRTSQYMTAIRDTLKGLVPGTVHTRNRDGDGLLPGLQMATSGRHCIFFEANESRVLVRQARTMATKLGEVGVAVNTLFCPAEREPKLPHEYQFNLDDPAGREALEADAVVRAIDPCSSSSHWERRLMSTRLGRLALLVDDGQLRSGVEDHRHRQRESRTVAPSNPRTLGPGTECASAGKAASRRE